MAMELKRTYVPFTEWSEQSKQIEYTEKTPLLSPEGKLLAKGWARRNVFEYNRDYVKKGIISRKEWDFYTIHVGDEMVDSKTSRTVVAVAPKSFMMAGYENGSFYRPGLAKNHHHVKPRTLEDVLVDMLEDAVGYSDAHTDVSLVAVEKYADEIRELLGGGRK